MQETPRHRCLMHEGANPRHLAVFAAEIRRKLEENYCCLFFNRELMLERLRLYLAAASVNVQLELKRSSLILSSEWRHLDKNGSFDVGRMIQCLSDSLDQALSAGYVGLWASGDMAWEFGPKRDFSKLLEYEWRVEELFRQHSELVAVCQYHADTLPREAVRKGFLVHPAFFISEALAIDNPYYCRPEDFTEEPEKNPALERALDQIYRRVGRHT